MQNTLGRMAILMVVFMTLVLLVGCGGQGVGNDAKPGEQPPTQEQKQAAPEQKAEPEGGLAKLPRVKVMIASPSKSDSIIPLFVAQRQGFFAEENLDAQLVEMAPNVAIASMISKGEVDFITALSSGATAAARGQPLKTLMVMMGRPSHRLVAIEDIKSVADLRGKTVAVGSVGALMDFELKAILKANNIPVSEVQVLNIKGEAERAALLGKQAQAAMLSIGGSQEALRKVEGAHVLLEAAKVFAGGVGGLTTSETKISAERDKIKRTLRAVLKAQQYMKTHRDETIQVIKEDIGYSPEVAQLTYDLVRDLYTDDGIGDTQMHQTTAEVATEMAELKEPVKPEQIFDFSIMKEILAEQKGS